MVSAWNDPKFFEGPRRAVGAPSGEVIQEIAGWVIRRITPRGTAMAERPVTGRSRAIETRGDAGLNP